MPTIPIHIEATKEEVKRHLAERAAKRRAEAAQRKLEEAKNASCNKSNILLSLLLIPLKLLYNYKQ